MSKALAGISDAQIATNYTFSQIKKLQEQTDAINVNAPYFQFDPANDVTNIGRNNNIVGAPLDSVIIGQDNTLAAEAGNVILIGDENSIKGNDNIIIGDQNAFYDGAAAAETREGNIIFSKGLTRALLPDATNNTIIVAPTGITPNGAEPIPSGSIIFGNGTTPSTQPKLQFGGANLIAALNGEALPNAGVPNAYIRIRYKNANYKIPVWDDDDDLNP